MKQNTIKMSCIALAISSVLTTQYAVAADENSTGEKQATLEHIEVTARKTVESLQNVPVAVTSVSAADLAENGISVITEIQQFSPNTTLQASRGTSSTLTAFIRGVGQEDPLWGYEPGVGIYIDDVYIARPQGAVLDILDVQRIEVLRGPQGTLYGKNTIGGAVKYVTKKMSGDAELSLNATVGSYAQKDFKIAGQYPLIDNKLYLGFALASLNRDGYGDFVDSALPDQDTENYNKDVMAGRISLEYTPTDDLFMRLTYDKTQDDSNAKGGYRLLPSLLTDAPVPDSKYDSYTSMPTWNKVETEGWGLTIEYGLNDYWTLKSVTSSRESYSPTNIDFDNTSLRIFDVPAIYDDEQFSQEFQANYDGENLKLVSGLYYFTGDSCGVFDAILEEAFKAYGGLTREVSGCNNSESYAAYVQGSYDITEQFSLTLGARFTRETKEATVYNGVIFDSIYPETGWYPGFVRDEDQIAASIPKVLDDEETWSRFTPRVGLEYQLTDDMMLFTSYSQGFKSGTFNPRATGPEPAVDPETVDSYELGVKSEWNDNLRINATAFYLNHKDRQFVTVLPGENAADLNQRLGNIGKSTATGLELEVEYAATESLDLFATLGLIDASFEEVISYDADGNRIDISDTYTITNTPDTTANIGFSYNIDTDIGSFVANGNYYYRSDYDLAVVDNLLSQEAYGLLNLGLNWYSNDGHWNAGLHWKNITDEEYLVGNYAFVTPDGNGGYIPGLGGDNTLIGYYGDPETISLTLGYNF
ncbi:TonB-dependent receptor [Shewanella sp. CG12_big_fil_rev_8_21_14_0_65_47_15]|uniref:TonB-dependent receptor n=1 Tax=Shewanella sp. CG12_big_fil_rev_8_21_14_0_65_47_15 TaxID=1975537 RepID=UPI000CAE93E5|nr:TonB-dependent receptor [Shewanella sp. CG12_big_fil_rev_8_21_14_0_65_47_15]PIW62076.1 MAG: ligand-gated channel protein [Shewanella sp. CG12_big_fil_rev_8_21_14_0_65_47_15]